MILGIFSLSTYTTIHVLISLIGIVTGFVVLAAMAAGRRPGAWCPGSCCSRF